MDKKLMIQALVKYMLGLVMVQILLFVPAGTLNYWNGWLFIGLLFVPMLFLGIILFVKAPDLLEKRLNTKEKEGSQRQVIGLSALMFLGGFIVSALDYRVGWTEMPVAVVIVAAVILLLSYGLYAEVMRENAYLSRTVEVQENQQIIDTGLYGIVRHPMYLASTLLFLSIPLVLGSIVGFLIFLIYPVLMVKRIQNEEEVLEKGLKGYSEYKKKVRYRLLPFIW
ncbi:MAG: isoprenylcysteine carboxylmethyltransferase family protein [Lachnospiraceae bacterium]|nr:isoprenylcysteine carboxylmethyltransferase family protein [Lachnospiraceae bacterium]